MKLPKTIIIFILLIKNYALSSENFLSLHSPKFYQLNVLQNLIKIFNKHDDDKFEHWKKSSYLKGANIHPYKKFSPYSFDAPINYEDLKELKKLGANLVVANFPGVFTYYPPYSIDSLHLINLDRIVSLTKKVGLNLVIAIRSGPGKSLYTFFNNLREDEILFYDSLAQEKYIQMCEFIVKRYINYKHLIGINFILEPHPDNPVLFNSLDDSIYFNFINHLVRRVRGIDTLIPIIIQPTSWANPEKFNELKKLTDERIVYSFNMYFPYAFTNEQNDSTYPGFYFVGDELALIDSSYLKSFLNPVKKFKETNNVPIFVNEYGGRKDKKGIRNYIHDLHEIFLEYGFHFAFYVWRSEWLEIDGNSFDEFNYEEENPADEKNSKNFLIEEFKRVWKIKTD